jgi:3-deoxy-D-manno-octulosonic-acid transferase
MKTIYALYIAITEVVFYLCYPLILLWVYIKNYRESIKVTGVDSNGGILIHAASMGEVNAIKPLVMQLKEMYPETKICITTSTKTGLQQAKSIDSGISAFLSCLDVYHLRNKQLNLLNPALICVVETEIWPNMLYWAKIKCVKVMFLNARMSAKSLSSYLRLRSMFRYLGTPIQTILAQSSEDAKRFSKVFAAPVSNAGNLKYSLQLKDFDTSHIRTAWGFSKDDFVICWGSSRPGEEALLLSCYPQLLKAIPKLKLIIAIRHLQRVGDVTSLLKEQQFSLYSETVDNPQSSGAEKQTEILVIDKMGVLDQAYSICDLAIVGGSFFKYGAHNPLEPAYYSKPIIIGDDYQSCKGTVKKLLDGDAIVVSNAVKLAEDILLLAKDEKKRQTLGFNAKKVLADNSSALTNHLSGITKVWENR